ncbi:MAG: glycosyltransferase [Dermabacteraceae bacterium]
MTLDVLYIRAGGNGWGPVDQLADLTARLLEGNLVTLQDKGEVSIARKVLGQLPRHRSGREALLVLASNPAHLAYAARLRHWLPGYRTTAAWVIDSFWSDRISRMAQGRGHFDHIFITDRDLQDEWASATGSAIHWAPWGTDTLAIKELPAERPVDLLRVGRQPAAWDDDRRTEEAASAVGLTFEGRPAMDPDPEVNQQNVRSALLRSKFVLAFSNLVSPAAYTHPTRDYVTGRWTDALGAGAIVVGVAPRAADRTLGPASTIEIDPGDLSRGLEQIREAVDRWTRSAPEQTHARARARLDWRWRIHEIALALELAPSARFQDELSALGAGAINR